MKTLLPLLFAFACIFFSCESSNMEDKYPGENSETGGDSTDILAHFSLDGSLSDLSGNNVPLTFVGDTIVYKTGLNSDHGQGLYLDGKSYLLVPLGFYDTLAVVFWIKGDLELNKSNKPVLMDYGNNVVSATLDAVSGATILSVQNNNNTASSNDTDIEALNSWNEYSFFYFEAGTDLTRVYLKGYFSKGQEVFYKEDHAFSGNIDPQTEILYIGRSSQKDRLANSMFTGAIDEIYIFNRRLRDEEIESFAKIQPD